MLRFTVEALLITRSEASRLLDPAEVLPALKDAFVRYSMNRAARPLRVRASLLGTEGSATVLFPGMVSGVPVYSVKVHAKFPSRSPAIQGVLCLHSLETGELLAIMDSTYLTAMRTGLTGALAADVLSRPEANTVAVIGAGAQGRQQLASLATLRDVKAVKVYDILPSAADAFCVEMGRKLDFPIESAPSVALAVRDAGIVLMATWSNEPLILPGMLAPGAHVTTLGPDEPGKVEVSAEVIRDARFFCDDADLAVEMGALAGAGLGRDSVAAELGEVLAGKHSGRTSASEVTVYGGVGLAFQDLVCAWLIYQSANRQGVGERIDFLA